LCRSTLELDDYHPHHHRHHHRHDGNRKPESFAENRRIIKPESFTASRKTTQA
jgi:hypothetical protein